MNMKHVSKFERRNLIKFARVLVSKKTNINMKPIPENLRKVYKCFSQLSLICFNSAKLLHQRQIILKENSVTSDWDKKTSVARKFRKFANTLSKFKQNFSNQNITQPPIFFSPYSRWFLDVYNRSEHLQSFTMVSIASRSQ